MYGYATVNGYVVPGTAKTDLKSGVVRFKIYFSADKKRRIFCVIPDKKTCEWFKKHIETRKISRTTVTLHGQLSGYLFKHNNEIRYKNYIIVEYIEFLYFRPTKFNAVDSGKFYDRKMLDWEQYFYEDKTLGRQEMKEWK